MFFFTAVLIGLLAFIIVMTLNYVFFRNKPIPLTFLMRLVACVTITYVYGIGVLGKEWGVAIVYLVNVYIGIGFALYETGDIRYYRNKYRKPQEENLKVYAPEDDPNWDMYRPNK